MEIVRTSGRTLVVLESEHEEFQLEMVCAHFEKPELDENVTVEDQKQLQDMADNLNMALDYTKFRD